MRMDYPQQFDLVRRFTCGASYSLFSHFQPILSLAHGRQIGVEGLLRAEGPAGRVAPPVLFEQAAAAGLTAELDSTAAELHVANFGLHAETPMWLFLNMLPSVALDFPQRRPAFEAMLLRFGLRPEQIVIEILEAEVPLGASLDETVRCVRDLGCLIAIDDFGAGHSNIDRIWQLEPDIVKLDRSLIAAAATHARVRRVLPSLISLLHEAGSMVVIEGIETADEALLAMDSDADFVQGFHFARPQPLPQLLDHPPLIDEALWERFAGLTMEEGQYNREQLGPYLAGLQQAGYCMEAGMEQDAACRIFLCLPHALRCFVLDGDGRQMGANMRGLHASTADDPRFAPLAEAAGARWSRRPYFRRAVHQMGLVQLTRPYLSLTGAHLCVTLSMAVRLEGKVMVVCGDVDWSALQKGAWPGR